MSSMLHLWLLRLRLNSPESGMVYGETFNISFRTSSFYMYLCDCQGGRMSAHPLQRYLCVCVCVCVCV